MIFPSEAGNVRLRAALAASGNPNGNIQILPGLNHLFQHAKTGGFEEYATIEETFAPEALAMIGDWIVRRRLSTGASLQVSSPSPEMSFFPGTSSFPAPD